MLQRFLDEVKALRDYLLDRLGLWYDEESGALVVVDSWDGDRATVLYEGSEVPAGAPGADILVDLVVTRWRATLAPPPREPKPGEVWRITLNDGTERTALVDTDEFNWVSDLIAIADIPADRRRLLIEADGTVVTGDE